MSVVVAKSSSEGCLKSLPLKGFLMNVSCRLIIIAGLISTLLLTTPCLSADGPQGRGQAAGAPSSQQLAEEIGSLRHARVAIPMPENKLQLTYFAWKMADAELAELKQQAPNVRIVSGLSPAEAITRAAEAHGVDARYLSPEFLAGATKLVWVQAMGAGVDRYVAMPPLVQNDAIVLTNFRGVYGPAIADHTMAMLLSLTRGLPAHISGDARGPLAGGGAPAEPIVLDGKTILIVGIGGIGTEIAKRAHAFGMRVIGTRRSASPAPTFIEKVGQPSDLLSMLPEADVVAIAVPLTAETDRLFNETTFAAMKHGSFLINIARGKIVDTDALTSALRSGKLAGAGLDVTDPEPLPAEHVLRKFPNVIITPHTAGISEYTNERASALLKENIRRFGAGEPLLNVVDKTAGY
ncbi:D-2-hydroxyacid dehydrogenase [Planctomicrobium sp. SH664]|uniref:D-2-hydroxyacid dehydrogenase n=1 Tax=Planctomicrobium sp. SH664 TaxID=3448125 RepID=UPI003F5B3D25